MCVFQTPPVRLKAQCELSDWLEDYMCVYEDLPKNINMTAIQLFLNYFLSPKKFCSPVAISVMTNHKKLTPHFVSNFAVFFLLPYFLSLKMVVVPEESLGSCHSSSGTPMTTHF